MPYHRSQQQPIRRVVLVEMGCQTIESALNNPAVIRPVKHTRQLTDTEKKLLPHAIDHRYQECDNEEDEGFEAKQEVSCSPVNLMTKFYPEQTIKMISGFTS